MRSVWLVVIWALSVTLAGLGLAVGCSSSPAKTQAGGDGGDASTQDVTAESAVDAGPDINQNPDVYPASHHPIPQLDYNGGPVIQHPRVVTVTFTGDPHRDGERGFNHFIVTSSWWQQTAESFCIDGGTYGGECVGAGSAVAPEGGAWLPDGSTADGGDGYLDVELAYDFPSLTVADSDIQTWLANHILAGDFPPSTDQTIYVIFFPSTATITTGSGNQLSTSCQQFAGYHGSIPAPDGGAGRPTYAVLPYCTYGISDDFDYQQLTFATSHELAEAVTDPDVNVFTPSGDSLTAFYLFTNDAWVAQPNNLSGVGGECGDLCALVSEPTVFVGGGGNPYDESGYNVTRIWSDQAAAQSMQPCQPWSPVYFGAALRTTAQPIPPDNHVSDGYVFVKRGQSVQVIADVFAQAPLPHDLLLYTGVPKLNATDPSDLAAPDDLITVTLSQQQVNNGDGVIVTFAAPSKASVGPYWMVIRSVLETNNYNDWPVIVYVQ
jgi:hypothetical protein